MLSMKTHIVGIPSLTGPTGAAKKSFGMSSTSCTNIYMLRSYLQTWGRENKGKTDQKREGIECGTYLHMKVV